MFGWLRRPAARLALALLAGYGAYLAIASGASAFFWGGYNALIDAWGVTARNAQYAPGWVRGLGEASPSLHAVFQNALVMLALWGLWRAFERRAPGAGPHGGASRGIFGARRGAAGLGEWGMGLLLAALLVAAAAALLLLTDTSRLGWRLGAPRITWMTLALLPAALMAAMGEELFARGYAMGMADKALGRPAGYAASVAATLLIHAPGGLTPMAALNVTLMGLLCGRMYERTGAIWMGVGFRLGWTYMAAAVAGFSGGENAVYEIYAASRYWLSGGDAGLMQGALAALLLALALLLLWRAPRRRAA
ncbi:MAG: CPBP family intramembrane metalloprotease [Clostridiales bacterium]|nr:CPBP family intramembrane metalloprotease [Clostridiales bacterium]